MAILNIVQNLVDKRVKRREDKLLSDPNIGYIVNDEVAMRMENQNYVMLKRDGTTYRQPKGDLIYNFYCVSVKLCHDESDVIYNNYLGEIGHIEENGDNVACIVVPRYFNPEVAWHNKPVS